MHIILCDKISAGKSTFCMGLVHRLIKEGVRISGWMTPPHMVQNEKCGHDFVAIEDGRMEEPIPFTRLETFEGSLHYLKYHFNTKAFERASQIAPGEGLFVMDEIGPLELWLKKGFLGAATRALSKSSSTLSVLRSGLLNDFCEDLKPERFRVFDLSSAADLEANVASLLTA